MNSNRAHWSLLSIFLLTGLCTVYAKDAAASLNFKCEELVSRSFPPNLNWLHFGQTGFDPHFYPTFAGGQWVEYVLQIPEPGTYEVKVQGIADHSCGMVQISIEGEKQGEPQDLFAVSRSPRTLEGGKHTFLKAGKAILRLQITGKNSQSQGYNVEFDSISLVRVEGFKLICPNGASFDEGNPLLQWQDLGKNFHYTVYLDDSPQAATADTFLQTARLSAGDHEWYVMAEGPSGEKQRSNLFHFTVGPAAPYPDREFSDDFEAGNLSEYVSQGMSLADSTTQGKKALVGLAHSLAYVKDLRLGLREGEVSALVSLDDSTSSASVGFTAVDGTRICATINSATGTLNLERTVKGYSIFAITPPIYNVAQWKENQSPDGAFVWQLASTPAVLKAQATYQLKLAYSRRSCAVMATLMDADGSNVVTLRDLSDMNLPDHPMVEVGQGKARFHQLTYRRLNQQVYPWDPDTNQIVLRPGPAGSWDSRGAFNSAIVIRDGGWYMVYRGNARPAPPTSGFASELGVATSTDGVHWTKYGKNPIIPRSPDRPTVEDPDLLNPAGTHTYFLEYVIVPPHQGVHEVMASSTDGIHFSEPWPLPVKGKIGGMIDTHSEPQIPEFSFNGHPYRYLGAIEEGGIYLSNDLHEWVRMGLADYHGQPDRWCDGHECAGDIFVDADHNLRVETQAGTKIMGKDRIGGNRMCSLVEDILSSSDPTRVLSRGDLPWLPDFYGDAPTGDLNEMTFTNGSVFPGQTIIKDGYLWHYYGGNNTYTGLIKAVYRPDFIYRDLHVLASSGTAQPTKVEVTIRNEGAFAGDADVKLLIDGKVLAQKTVTVGRDKEANVSFPVNVPKGQHCVAIDDLSVGISGETSP